MATFTLTIEMGNEAMQEPWDISMALRNAADRIESGAALSQPGIIMDINGNRVGSFKLTDD